MSSRILIVEDDAIVAAHLERAIVRMGYQVAGLVATGEDAIAQAEALHPDVIVMDIRLRSEMNGVEAAVQIRARADIPIIYLSAYADENFVNAATATQAYGYLTKPVRDKELNASIEVALYKSRTDRALAHLNEVLRAIRSVNQLIVHERDSGRLLDHACQLLVTIRGYHHASIVAPRKRPSELFLLHFAAAEGVNASPFEAILGQPIDDSLPCLLAAALRKAIVSEDLIGDAAPPRWRERAKALGIGAQMSAPMWLGAQLYGVLSVYSAFPRAFDPDEVAVLSELASDLAVALRNHAADAERQRGEQALRTSQQAYRELVENLNDVVFSLDALGLVTYLSPAIRDVSGYAPDELVGRPFLDVVQADDHAKVQRALDERSGPSGPIEFRALTATSKTIWVRASIRPSVQKGRIVGITGLLTDITEQKALSAQLRQAQKMEAIGLMAGGVAHDFNNLLQAMTTEIGLLCARADDPRAVATHGLELDESVRRGALLTRQLLLFSRQQTAEPVPLDLNEVIAQTIAMLRRMVRDDVKLVMVLGDGALPVVADRGQLDQVLMNLVLNSSDAMPQGGTITVRSGRHAGRAWFSVADTGSGIPAEIRERIFEPFFTTKTTGKGSGLGLAVVHGIVAHHAGTIGVESELDVGTTFTITLPAVSRSRLAAAKVETPAAPVSLEGRGERVLLVEDEDGARQGLAEILAMLGYEVLALPNGEEAGTLPNDPAFDLVISDLFLPGIAGPPLVAGLRDRWPGLKVILMSGYAEEDVLRSALCAGKVRFLQKPFDIDTLAREIRLALGEPSTSS